MVCIDFLLSYCPLRFGSEKMLGVISLNTKEEMSSKCTIHIVALLIQITSNTKMVMPEVRRANQLIAVVSVTFLNTFTL